NGSPEKGRVGLQRHGGLPCVFSTLSLLRRGFKSGKAAILGLTLVLVLVSGIGVLHRTALAAGREAAAPVVYNESSRRTIVEMIRAAREGNWSKARDLAAAAREPLAGAIYSWLVYDDSRDSVEFSKIASFLSAHPDWPRRGRMRLLAEESLPETLSDARVLAFFKTEPPVTASGMGRYVDALIRAKREQDARKTLEPWWRSKTLPAPEQAEFLSRYGRLLSKESHRIRIDALLEAQGYTAARALAPHVGKGFGSVVEARIAIARGKPGVNALIDHIPARYLHDPGLDYDRLVYRRRAEDNDAAVLILNREPDASKLSDPAAWWKERQIVARRLVEAGQARRAWMLVKGRGG
ncbi:MAG TPA: hypothetical protein PKX87_09835, partial [Alphaproteobacteria bacterium]|nr:hypothetical protein [Alphaproteobacteria bacterium]